MPAQPTRKDTVRLLCKHLISRLEHQGAIEFSPRVRQGVQDELWGKLASVVLTDEDFREKALAKIGGQTEAIQESALTETEAFRTARTMIKRELGQEELNGFYFQMPIRSVATEVRKYLMSSNLVEDVFESDEDLERKVVEMIQRFKPEDMH
jgi:hypothetical protein